MMRALPERIRDFAPARGFTLAELVVVVALVALLTVGIGRLFAGVSSAVTRGLATSELDAAARAIEESLRRDIALMNRMNSEDTFLVIRSTELGGDPDRPIYLSQDDREADVRDRVSPYDEGSRAVTTRLDELAFLARAPGAGAFRSQQDNGAFTADQPSAPGARLYYGHGLRPRLDPNWPPENPNDPMAPDAPQRQFVSDGWFGSAPANADGRDYLPDGQITGRNEYASDWVLARQALLLYGPRATGVADPGNSDPPTGADREYAPYVRDLETLSRFWDRFLADAPSGDELLAWPGPVNPLSSGSPPRPDPRLIGHGRVDIAAQTIEDVRRWLEGEAPEWDPGQDAYEATPWAATRGSAFGVTGLPSDVSGSRYELSPNDLLNPGNIAAQRWLWKRSVDPGTTPRYEGVSPLPTGLLNIGGTQNPLEDLTYNLIGVRSAIAGVLTRPLLEVEPTIGSRSEDTMLSSTADELRFAAEQDAPMDTHAVLAPRCSRFEIAWSDGSYWLQDRDLDNDGMMDVRAGDLVWFDPTRTGPNAGDLDAADRMTFAFMWRQYGDRNFDGGVDPDSPIRWAVLYTDPDALRLDRVGGPLGGEDGFPISLNPEIGYGDAAFFNSTPTFNRASTGDIRRRLWVKTGGAFTEAAATTPPDAAPYYNPDLTGGAPSEDGWPDGPAIPRTDDIGEYLAIWPFRVPSSTGEWGDAFEKNVWLRVRYTLHDEQRRVERTYEVVLHVHPRDRRG